VAGPCWLGAGAPGRREAGGYTSDFHLDTYFMHDIGHTWPRRCTPLRCLSPTARSRTNAASGGWPAAPIHMITARDDRFFPLQLQQRVARDELGTDPQIVPGERLAALSQPRDWPPPSLGV